MLYKDRLEDKNVKKITRKILIKNINNNEVKLFNSVIDCINYLNNIAPSNKSTLFRHIESKEPYNGYICLWNSEKTIPLKDKAIEVNVTNILDGRMITYPSFRKAALSFAPNYITTGSTIKAFAESGKLFKDKYKITINTKDTK